MMTSLIYKSVKTNNFSDWELSELLYRARNFNDEQGITGMLVSTKNYFAQYIEGEAAKIEMLFEKIKNDNRHESIVLLKREFIKRRLFENWDMLNLDLNTNKEQKEMERMLDSCSGGHLSREFQQFLVEKSMEFEVFF